MLRGMRWLAALCLCAIMAMPCAFAESTGSAKAEDITKSCAFKVSEGSKYKVTDDDVRTSWTYGQAGAYVGVKLPDGVQAGWLRVEWMFDPTGFELLEYDADRNVIRQRDQTCTFPNIYTLLPLLPETKYIQLKMTATDQEVCTVKVYSAGELPRSVQLWQPPVEKADVMLVSTHQDDEIVFMGGTIPYYATALKKPMIVVYMANCTRYRRNEALNSLWTMGVTNYPEFINLKDKRTDTLEEAVNLWGGKDNILALVVERIRRFKPEVIVTHDLDGEYGHNQHKVTSRCMKYAIEAAADETRYPESAQKYGTWQVKKLYLHLYKENELMMDWETPLDSLNGYSPLQVAQMGMEKQASQLKYYAVKSHGKYDNAKFGLYYTTVGPDVAKNDFLENIDPDASAKYLAEHGAATAAAILPEAEPLVEETLVEDNFGADGVAEDVPAEAPADGDGAAEEAPVDAPVEAPAAADGAIPEPVAGDDVVSEPVEPAVAEAGEQALTGNEPQTFEAPPQAAAETGGGVNGVAIALGAVGVAALGAGGWAGYRAMQRKRRRRRRRRPRR